MAHPRPVAGERSLTTIANHVKTLTHQRYDAPMDEGRKVPLTDAVQQSLFAGAASTWDELLAAAEDIITGALTTAEEKVVATETAHQRTTDHWGI